MKPIEILCLVLIFTTALVDSVNPSKAEKQVPSLPSKLSPLDTIPDVIFTGESDGDYFGAGLAASGDLNGDEYADIVIGARCYNSNQGRAYIYFGGKDISATPDMILTGEAAESRFGNFAIGDIDNDCQDDLLIASVGYDSMRGRVYLYYGGKDFNGNCDKMFEGEPGTTGRFGFRLALGDVNNDGLADLAVSADNYGAPPDSTDLFSGQGRVYLYYGAAGRDMDTTADKIFDGEKPGNIFGRYLAIGKDVDGDGYGDLLVGAPDWDNFRGRAYLYYGGPGTTMDTVCGLTFTGENPRDSFSRALNFGDINGDHYADIVVGASTYGKGQGRAYIFYGAHRSKMNAIPNLTLHGGQGDNFGIGVVLGDIDNDGLGDILLGADNCYKYRGRVYLYYSGKEFDRTPDLIFDGESPMINFGRYMDIGDVNGDNYADIVIGAWSYPNRTFQGRAYLYYGGPKN